MIYRSLALVVSSLALLSACSTAMEGATQKMTVLTPGAEGASCLVTQGANVFKVRPPQTVTVFRSKDPLKVACEAPGNREVSVDVPAGRSETFYVNASNLMIGAAYDAATGAWKQYPDTVVVDFSGMPLKPFPVPAHERTDALPASEEDGIEYMGPGVPSLNEDAARESARKEKRLDAMLSSGVAVDRPSSAKDSDAVMERPVPLNAPVMSGY